MGSIDPILLHGRTIRWIDTTSANCWLIKFTDGSVATLESETKVSTQFGNISGPVISELTPPK